MGLRETGKNFTYKVGNQSFTPSQLSNHMSGTEANSIYYASHNGSGYSRPETGNTTSTPVYTEVPDNGSRRPTGSSSSSMSASLSGSGYGGGYDYAGMIQSMLDQQRAAAQAAYDASKARLDEAWGNTQNALSENLNSSLARLKENYTYGAGKSRNDAQASLRDAYITHMMNKRNLGQNLAAMGMSGGATESSLAKLYNQYGNSKNGIRDTLANNLAELMNTYNNNVAAANQAYNTQYADAMNNYVANLNQLEQMLANNMMGSYSGSSLSNLASYASTLADLQNQMAAAAAATQPTQNTLELNNLSTTQGTDLGTVTDYAKYLAAANQDQATNVIRALSQAGVPTETIYQMFGAA